MTARDKSVSTSSFLALCSLTPAITPWIDLPSSLRNRRWRTLRETGTWASTSSTPIPSQACSRMNRIAAATSGSAMALTSVEWRATTSAGGIDTRSRRLGLPSHQAIEQRSRLVADAPGVRDDGGEGWAGQLADQLFVVHADHGDLFRHRDPGPATGVEGLGATEIVASHQPQGLGERLDPRRDTLDLHLPGRLLVAPRDPLGPSDSARHEYPAASKVAENPSRHSRDHAKWG